MKRGVLFGLVTLFTGLWLINACQLTQPDNFICGHRLPSGEATFCNGQNEVCVCETQRCAVEVTEQECTSRLRYTFGDEKCVAQDHIRTALTENTSKNLCPQESLEPAACGAPGTAGACPADQYCLCGARSEGSTLTVPARQCVRKSQHCGKTGWAWAYNGECVEGVDSAEELVLRGATDPVCPGTEAFARTCGLPQGRNNQACPATEDCLCGTRPSGIALTLPLYTCVVRNRACDFDGGLGISDRDGRCLMGAASPADLIIQQTPDAACPGTDLDSLFPDGGVPDAGAPQPPPCGVPLDGGVRGCGPSRACLCGVREDSMAQLPVAPYACVSGHPDCRLDGGTGLLTERGQCVNNVPPQDIVLRLDSQGLCPGFDLGSFFPDAGAPVPDAGVPPPPPPCGVPLDGGVRECGAQRACLCGAREGSQVQLAVEPYVCVSGHPACRPDGGSGLITEFGQCVGAAQPQDIVLRFDGQGVCPGFDLDPYRPDGGSLTGGQ